MRKRKLIIIQGIPGSGKSYLAKKILKKDKSNQTIIVNRDLIRSMLGKYWVPSRESLVTDIELWSISTGLQNRYTVIVDATNLNPKTLRNLKRIAEEEEAEVEYETIQISVIQAYIQILWRTVFGGRYISFKVIRGFYNRYKNIIEV